MIKNIIIITVIYITIVLTLKFMVRAEEYKYLSKRCVSGHYEYYETGGLSVSKNTLTSNRTEEIWVCDESVMDTVTDIKFVIKRLY